MEANIVDIIGQFMKRDVIKITIMAKKKKKVEGIIFRITYQLMIKEMVYY